MKTHCPHCDISLQGPSIPLKDQKQFGGATHSRTEIGFYSRELDITLFWICSSCGKGWHRWPIDTRRYIVADNAMKRLGYYVEPK